MTFRGRHRQVKLPRPSLFEAKFKAYIVRIVFGGPGVKGGVSKVLSGRSIPIFTGLILFFPVIAGGAVRFRVSKHIYGTA